jgi:putative membrane protein insertion efficiency factor
MKLHIDTQGMNLPSKLWAWRVWPFLALVWLYKRVLSPALPSACRYEPTCSEYAFDAIKQRGIVQGIIIGTLRILRCAPWGGHGYDPVEAFRWPWQRGRKHDV